jgi:hypothetical protein
MRTPCALPEESKMKDKQQKKPVSPKQLAANRKNGQYSNGPNTPEGKRRASQNSYKHGFFALRLFPNNEVLARDGADYNRILASLRNHYLPQGDLEDLCVEKIATYSLRLARLLGHEQDVFAWRAPFEARSVDKIIRYESNINRQLEKTTRQLERLQEAREAESDQIETSGLESDDAISSPDEATDEGFETPGQLIPEEPQELGASSKVGDASLTALQPHVETDVKRGSAPIDVEPSNRPTETGASNPPPPESGALNAGAETLAQALERALDIVPADSDKGGLSSGEKYGTVRSYPRRLFETAEEEGMIERIKRGDDLDQLE